MHRTIFKRKQAPKPILRAGHVTALEPQAQDPTRFNLYIDNNFVLGLAGMVAAQVRVGDVMSAEDIARLADEEEFESARASALHYLEFRPRSQDEIHRHLGRKYSKDLIQRVIERLRDAGLLGDEQFADYWVETRETFKPRSARALKHELRQKGVAPELIDHAVKNLDENESAYRAARRQAERWRALEYREFQTKLGGFLARRGFNYDVVKETAKRLHREFHQAEPEAED